MGYKIGFLLYLGQFSNCSEETLICAFNLSQGILDSGKADFSFPQFVCICICSNQRTLGYVQDTK